MFNIKYIKIIVLLVALRLSVSIIKFVLIFEISSSFIKNLTKQIKLKFYAKPRPKTANLIPLDFLNKNWKENLLRIY